MTLLKVPPIGSIVTFEGHKYMIISQRRGVSTMTPVDDHSTFGVVDMATKDIQLFEPGELQHELEKEADIFVASSGIAEKTEHYDDKKEYTDHLVRRQMGKFNTQEPEWGLPRRHLIRSRHWRDQQDKGE